MVFVLLMGAGAGVGLWALAVWLFPPRPALGTVLARITTASPPPIVATEEVGWAAKLGRPFVAPSQALGLPGARVRRDLGVIGRATTLHLGQKALLALGGLLAPVLLQLLLALTGLWLGVDFPIIAGLVLAVAGFLLPDLQVRSAAAKRRTAFHHALSAYLDLAWTTLAGGAGIDSALNNSAAIGRGWSFEQIRRALGTARLTRTSPWTTLRRLGEELDITELVELAASISLAGTEGAKVRASLAAKAAALRTHQLTSAEAEAQAATERMSLPVTALFLGFLLFIACPALHQVLSGL
ncbi:secretion system protein [Amycolatopsis rhizosphaerae]|uniref:Secretion system protein n=1 Tax=Amycolatopsis rhizosphaerae TaxID=2053003 RepID=A0A558CTK4_9PSEU|nr:type II secretion system F family protein [Amycolatopsis rhizosphaerae]TVT52022.1 secretion system protein [Amycolatopsis rhizosphaerae]